VRESVLALAPIFILFLITHAVLITVGLASQGHEVRTVSHSLESGWGEGLSSVGGWGLCLLLLRAYSFGGGTYTGIEAVSNGMPIMREPKVQTGQRTMRYMAGSLAFTASGLLVCYLLWGVGPETGKTMNAVLTERFAGRFHLGHVFVVLTLISEGALLVVGAQAGFIDGPRVLANMALDSWMPRRFSALSDRLTTANGIRLMGAAALVAVYFTRGNIHSLIVMYSLNVFVTFSLSMIGMARLWWGRRQSGQPWKLRFSLFVATGVLCLTILTITVLEKFKVGGWITIAVTGTLVGLCLLIHRHYLTVGRKLGALFAELEPAILAGEPEPAPGPLDPEAPTAAVLVASYSGLGILTLSPALRMVRGHFRTLVSVSAGAIDSGVIKGEEAMATQRVQTEDSLKKYVALAQRLGVAATYRFAIGTDALDVAEKLCLEVSREFPRTMFFAGKIILHKEKWYERALHNETAFAIQKRLQLSGKTMVIIPAVVR